MVRRLAERAVSHLSDVDIEKLASLDRDLSQSITRRDYSAAADLDLEFHRMINRAGNSPILLRFVRETTPFVHRLGGPEAGTTGEQFQGHSTIIKALRRRDVTRAGELMARHVVRSGELADGLKRRTEPT
jgi:DNA-binding GntR family transcriptional regulator